MNVRFPSDTSALGTSRSITEMTDGSKDLMGERRVLYASFNMAFIRVIGGQPEPAKGPSGTEEIYAPNIRVNYEKSVSRECFKVYKHTSRELMVTIYAKKHVHMGEDSMHFF